MQKIDLVSKTPLIATSIFMVADSSQIVRMFSEGSAKGQSLWGWLSIIIALSMYAIFFRVKTPNERLAFWCTVANVIVVSFIAITVVYFRYIHV